MKLIQGILGCTLAAGLTAGTLRVEAAPSNIVYTKLSINLMVQYNDAKGTIREATLTSKDLLKLLGYPKKDELATDYDGFGDPASVFVINKDGVVADLTDTLSIDFSQIVNKRQDEGKNGSFDQSEKGVLTLNLDFTGSTPGVVAQSLPLPTTGELSFDASGVYYWEASGNSINKNGEQKISTKLTAHSFTGNGFDSEIAPAAPSIQSDAKTPGDGDFLVKDGKVNGTGKGTIVVD